MRRIEAGLASLIAVVGVAILLCTSLVSVLAEGPTGNLKVNTNPSVPTTISVDGVRLSDREINKVPLAAGQHTLSFTDVPGFVTPGPMELNVSAGDTTSVVASFVALGGLKVVSQPAVQTTISVDGVPRDDWGMWLWIAAGTHTVSFGQVAGYDSPQNITVKVRAGYVSTVTGMFTENPNATAPTIPGMLRVTSTPAVATTISVDGVPRDTFGLQWLKIEPGIHVVSFSDVPGFMTPAPMTVTVGEGGVAIADGSFTAIGTVRIVTAPPNSSLIYIDGVPRDTWGLWLTLPAGIYSISFGAVPGHTTPAPQTIQVVAGQIALVYAA